MNLSRREFTILSATSAAALATGAWPARALARPRVRRFADTYFEFKPIGDKAWAAFGEGGNSLAIVSGGDLLLIDTKNSPFGTTLRREAGATATSGGKAPALRYVVNTHHHADHTGGNIAFTSDVPVVAQTKARDRVLAQLDRYKGGIKGAPGQLAKSEKPAAKAALDDITPLVDKVDGLKPEQYAPTEVFDSERVLRLESVTVRLTHRGSGHTDNDAIVFIPELNILHAGDLLFHRVHPFMDRPAGANTPGWIESVNLAISMCNDKTVVVPGHGELTDVSGLRGQIKYFQTTVAAVEKAIAEGKTRDEVEKMIVEEFKDYGFDQIRPRTMGAIFDEIKERK
jgi:glyoxylase-like metal-dependent hydrolase (beta-lactamase superfamily II)